MNNYFITLFICFIFILILSTTLSLYYKKTDTKSFQVGIKYLPNNEWTVDLSEFGKNTNELIMAKKYNYYDHNLYTYDIMPLDIIEYYYQGNNLKVFIKPIQYKYYYFKKDIKVAPDLLYYYQKKLIIILMKILLLVKKITKNI